MRHDYLQQLRKIQEDISKQICASILSRLKNINPLEYEVETSDATAIQMAMRWLASKNIICEYDPKYNTMFVEYNHPVEETEYDIVPKKNHAANKIIKAKMIADEIFKMSKVNPNGSYDVKENDPEVIEIVQKYLKHKIKSKYKPEESIIIYETL